MKDRMHTSGAVAAELGLPRWRLAYLIEKGSLPRPTFQVPGRRLFTDADILAIRKALEAKPALRAPGCNRDS